MLKLFGTNTKEINSLFMCLTPQRYLTLFPVSLLDITFCDLQFLSRFKLEMSEVDSSKIPNLLPNSKSQISSIA